MRERKDRIERGKGRKRREDTESNRGKKHQKERRQSRKGEAHKTDVTTKGIQGLTAFKEHLISTLSS